MAGALVSDNEEVVIDGSGYTGRTKSTAADAVNGYDKHQIKITGKNIIFTDDGWDSAKTAIGELLLPDDTRTYGINAEAVIGELIIGERLRLQNPGETLTFDENGLSVQNNTNTFTLDPGGDTLVSIKKGNHEIFGLDSNGALHVEADGTGIDLSSNDSILGLNASLQTTAKEIKATVSSAVSKYDTSSVTVHLYGYGLPSANYDASNYNTLYYLNQATGVLYQSNGTEWVQKSRLNLITDNLQSQISVTEREIKSTVGQAVSKYDVGNRTIALYGYSAPSNDIYDASAYNNQYYLNQSNGYLYQSNGSGWVYQEALTLITTNLQSQISQNASAITQKVSVGDLGTQIRQCASDVQIAWNNITQYIQLEEFNNKAAFAIYDSNDVSTKNILLRLTPEGIRIYRAGTELGKIGTNGLAGTNHKGIVFDLGNSASYMSWAYQETPGASYSMKWTYWGNNNESSLSTADTLNAGCPIDMHSFELRNSKLKNVTVFLDSLGYLNTGDTTPWAGISGTWTGKYPTAINPDGTIQTWSSFSLVFQNGILTSASW